MIEYSQTVYGLIKPILFSMNPESAHGLTFSTLRALGPLARGLSQLGCGSADPRLRVQIAGLDWASPIGLAAGLDKNGVLARFWPSLGFGAVELGTVTALAQAGNPKPRLFRFPTDGALINRMGFNNAGSERFSQRLSAFRRACPDGPVPIGVNLGKSKVTPLDEAVDDYATSTERTARFADYLVVNVSSPNTPGLRELQGADHLQSILAAVVEKSEKKPVFVKFSPDLHRDALSAAIEVVETNGAAGIIATNTSVDHRGIGDVGAGGLSGAPIREQSLEVVSYVASRTELPVIAVGGIHSLDGVLDALAAGAAAVQIYTGLIMEGPGLIHILNTQLLAFIEKQGCGTLAELLERPVDSWRPSVTRG
jgi:dihydroorotate dehydrogenase